MSFSSATSNRLFRSLRQLPPSLRQTVFQQAIRNSTSTISIRHASSSSTTTDSTQQSPSSSSSPDQLIPPPSPTSGPLLSRLPNRALPNITPGLTSATRTWLLTLPIFLTICALGSLSIFNYQKSSSSTVSSILYAMRTSPTVRSLLGDEIYFASRIPWISGELNQLHGHIDISFWVKGTKGKGLVRFVSIRRRRDGYFETLEWSLRMEETGKVVELLELEGRDPMSGSRTQQVIAELDAKGEL